MKIIVELKKIELDNRIISEIENFHKNSKSIYNEGPEQFKSCFNIISVKDNDDIIKANDLFSEIDITILSDKEKFIENSKNKPVKDNFLIKDNDGWRIQSHYLGTGMSVESLEKCISYITKHEGFSKKDKKDKKDYLRDRILSRIEELKTGRNLYDMNISDKTPNIIKPRYSDEGIKFWERVPYIIEELEKFIK